MRGTSRWNGGGGIPDAICPGGMAAGGIPYAMCPDGMAAEEFRMRYVRGGMAAGGIPNVICPDGMNVVMSSMKDRYGLYGYGDLGEWF